MSILVPATRLQRVSRGASKDPGWILKLSRLGPQRALFIRRPLDLGQLPVVPGERRAGYSLPRNRTAISPQMLALRLRNRTSFHRVCATMTSGRAMQPSHCLLQYHNTACHAEHVARKATARMRCGSRNRYDLPHGARGLQ
jgi:hypothetical protein